MNMRSVSIIFLCLLNFFQWCFIFFSVEIFYHLKIIPVYYLFFWWYCKYNCFYIFLFRLFILAAEIPRILMWWLLSLNSVLTVWGSLHATFHSGSLNCHQQYTCLFSGFFALIFGNKFKNLLIRPMSRSLFSSGNVIVSGF